MILPREPGSDELAGLLGQHAAGHRDARGAQSVGPAARDLARIVQC